MKMVSFPTDIIYLKRNVICRLTNGGQYHRWATKSSHSSAQVSLPFQAELMAFWVRCSNVNVDEPWLMSYSLLQLLVFMTIVDLL